MELHPVKNVSEDFQVVVGGEVHVGMAVVYPRNSEVRNERTSCGLGTIAGDV